jgi:hypothetical protein
MKLLYGLNRRSACSSNAILPTTKPRRRCLFSVNVLKSAKPAKATLTRNRSTNRASILGDVRVTSRTFGCPRADYTVAHSGYCSHPCTVEVLLVGSFPFSLAKANLRDFQTLTEERRQLLLVCASSTVRLLFSCANCI